MKCENNYPLICENNAAYHIRVLGAQFEGKNGEMVDGTIHMFKCHPHTVQAIITLKKQGLEEGKDFILERLVDVAL